MGHEGEGVGTGTQDHRDDHTDDQPDHQRRNHPLVIDRATMAVIIVSVVVVIVVGVVPGCHGVELRSKQPVTATR